MMEQTSGKNAIQITDLSFSIQAKTILQNISLTVSKHNFVGLIGPNGSGKTTLIRHIYRAIPPPKKTVYLYGREIAELNYREAAKEITVMRQENNSDFPYTILEMVLMGRSPYRKLFEGDTKEDKDIAKTVLKQVGMEHLANRKYSTLSGGEKQRVLIARSLAQEADILLLDEPTNHLDVHYQWSLMETIKNLKKTVLAVFHDLNLACTFCDYLYVLQEQRIVAEGAPAEVCTQELLAKVFRIDAEITHTSNGIPRILYNGALM